MFGGTYNGHPLSMAAALATIEILEADDRAIHRRLFRLGETIQTELEGIVDRLGMVATPTSFGSVFVCYFTEGQVRSFDDALTNDAELYVAFHRGMIERGFLMLPLNLKRNHLTAAHSDEDVARMLQAAEDVLGGLAGRQSAKVSLGAVPGPGGAAVTESSTHAPPAPGGRLRPGPRPVDVGTRDRDPGQSGRGPRHARGCRRGRRGDPDRGCRDRHRLRPARRRPRRRPGTSRRDPVLQHRHGQGGRAGCQAAGIPVRNVPDYCADEVSDHALALLLAAQRRILPFATATAAGGWPNDKSITGSIRRLRGQTLGIAGAGRIGRLVAAKARAFGFRTIAFDPFITASVDPDLQLVDRDELFATSDAIVVCAAYTPGAPPLISREALAGVKPGLIVVNISRGGHIDEHALAEALAGRSGRRRGARRPRHRATRPGRRSAVRPAQRRPDPAHRGLLARGGGGPAQARRRVRPRHARGRRPHLGGRLMARYPQGILVACPSPWDDRRAGRGDLPRRGPPRAGGRLRALLRVRHRGRGLCRRHAALPPGRRRVLRGGRRRAVSADGRRHRPVDVQIVERIGYAYDVGFRTFQISLPAWGPLDDDELLRFFADVCGTFPDSRFLHYNLPRTKRVLSGRDYARIVPSVPNLVATKNTGGGMAGGGGPDAPRRELMHFMGEGNYPHGAMFGECVAPRVYAELAPRKTRAVPGGPDPRRRELFALQHEFQRLSTDLWARPSPARTWTAPTTRCW